MNELIEKEDVIFGILCKTDSILPLCNMLYNHLSQSINSNADKHLYLYNYERNLALISVIMDGIDEIRKTIQYEK